MKEVKENELKSYKECVLKLNMIKYTIAKLQPKETPLKRI